MAHYQDFDLVKIIILILLTACGAKDGGKQDKKRAELSSAAPVAPGAESTSQLQPGSVCRSSIDPGFLTRVRYRESSVATGSCTQEIQYSFCQNGIYSTFTGSFTHENCSVLTDTQGRSCGNLAHGQSESRIRYQSSSVAFGQQCVFETQTRQCNDGLLGSFSGSYTATTCFVMNAQTCDGVPNGQTRTRVRYNVPLAREAGGCVAETQVSTCSNGAFTNYTGTYEFEACRVMTGSLDPNTLFLNARAVLDNRCLNCHSGLSLYPDFNVRPGATLNEWRAIMNQNSGLIITGSRWYDSEFLTRTRFHFKGGDARTMPPSGTWSEQDYIRVADWIFSLPNDLEASPSTIESNDVTETFVANSFEDVSDDSKGSSQTATRLSHFEYSRTIEDIVHHFFKDQSDEILKGLDVFLKALPLDPQFQDFGDSGPSTSNQVVEEDRLAQYLNVAKRLGEYFEREWRSIGGDCSDSVECIIKFLNEDIVHFYRRPLQLDEIHHFLQIYHSGSIAEMITNILMSPAFMYISPETTGTTSKELDAYDLATRLSYALWSSKPDQILFDLASNAQLLDDDVYEAQVRRMMDDVKFRESAAHFVSEWLRLDDASAGLNNIQEVRDLFVDQIFNPITFTDLLVGTKKNQAKDGEKMQGRGLLGKLAPGQVLKAVRTRERLLCLESTENQSSNLSLIGTLNDTEQLAESFYVHRCFSLHWWRKINRRVENLNLDSGHLQSIYESLDNPKEGMKKGLMKSVTHPNFKNFPD